MMSLPCQNGGKSSRIGATIFNFVPEKNKSVQVTISVKKLQFYSCCMWVWNGTTATVAAASFMNFK